MQNGEAKRIDQLQTVVRSKGRTAPQPGQIDFVGEKRRFIIYDNPTNRL
jgi:hypothetical protein